MSTLHDIDRTTFAPRADDVTSACAWASSPLGDPSDRSVDVAYAHDFPPDPITPAAKPKSIDKVMVAAGLIGAIGAGVALGITLFDGSPQPRSVAVASGSTRAPAAVPASAAPAPAPAAAVPAAVVPPADNGPAPAPVVSLPHATPQGPAPAAVVATGITSTPPSTKPNHAGLDGSSRGSRCSPPPSSRRLG